jgi:DUF1680 family protein
LNLYHNAQISLAPLTTLHGATGAATSAATGAATGGATSAAAPVLVVSTRWPEDDAVTIVFSSSNTTATNSHETPPAFELMLRIPRWISAPTVAVTLTDGSGAVITNTVGTRGSYLPLGPRQWTDGDTVTMQLKMQLKTTRYVLQHVLQHV